MTLQEVVTGVYRVSFGMVSAYLILDDGLTLIDSGYPGSETIILEGIRELGMQPEDLHFIVLTHLHPDHVGSAKAMQEVSGAKVYMHPLDEVTYLQGVFMRYVQPAPGLVNKIVVNAFINRQKPVKIDITPIDGELTNDQELPFAGGLKVIATPGHTIGHVALYYPKQGGVLFAGDACSAMFRLGPSPIYEDFAEGLRSLKKLSALSFQAACFGHGNPIKTGADVAFRRKWG